MVVYEYDVVAVQVGNEGDGQNFEKKKVVLILKRYEMNCLLQKNFTFL